MFVCPLDQRRFASRAALRQHERDSHRAAARAPARVRRAAPSRKPLTQGSVLRTSGTDELGTFMVSQGQQVGRLLAYMPIGPEFMATSRFKIEGKLYQRWRPVSMKVRYIGAGPATAGGSFAIAWTPDSTNQLPHEQPGLGLALSAERNALVRMDTNASLVIPSESAFKWYQTDVSGPAGAHGAVVAVLASAPNGIRGSVAITVVLDWVVEWQGRKLELASAAPGARIKPDAGYTNLFTTSDGSFDSTVLTFKAHAGGSMVPFSSALPGVIYTTQGTNTKVTYKDANSANKTCEFFSLVVGYEMKGLVLHSSQSEAEAYQRTGDRSHVLTYHAAGDYVTPVSPEFISLAVGRTPEVETLTILERLEKLELALQGFQILG